jgi:hypothetical protein
MNPPDGPTGLAGLPQALGGRGVQLALGLIARSIDNALSMDGRGPFGGPCLGRAVGPSVGPFPLRCLTIMHLGRYYYSIKRKKRAGRHGAPHPVILRVGHVTTTVGVGDDSAVRWDGPAKASGSPVGGRNGVGRKGYICGTPKSLLAAFYGALLNDILRNMQQYPEPIRSPYYWRAAPNKINYTDLHKLTF